MTAATSTSVAAATTYINAPLVLDGERVALFPAGNRQVPHVSIDAKPQFTCTVERVPEELGLNFDYINRFFANGNLAVTIRLQDVERVRADPNAGKVLVARPSSAISRRSSSGRSRPTPARSWARSSSRRRASSSRASRTGSLGARPRC